MFFRITTVISVVLLTGCYHTYKLYLGDDASRYLSGPVTSIIGGDSAHISFLDYRTCSHQLATAGSSEDVKRAGVVLTAKSILITTIEASAVFGNTTDSSTIAYKTVISRVRNGRSALTSISNLLSKKADKTPQREPDTTLQNILSEGRIILHDEIFPFSYHFNFNNNHDSRGWLILGGDTLFARNITGIKDEKGNTANPKSAYVPGVELVKNNTVCAVYEQGYATGKVHLLKQLAQKEKDIIAAYFFIAACYH